jgi:hypothetical protein
VGSSGKKSPWGDLGAFLFIMVTPFSFTEYPMLAAHGAGNIQVKEVLSWVVSVDSEDYAAAI